MYCLLSIAGNDRRHPDRSIYASRHQGSSRAVRCPHIVEAFHGLAPAASNRLTGGSSPEDARVS